MNVFAVSDLHLPGGQDKPMDVFGGDWAGHLEKIKADWRGKVSKEDIVLIAGDISWAMTLESALPDLNALADLPGRKIFIRGNHDYWWSGITALRRSAPDDSFYFLQNDCVRFDGLVVCGSRGWACPGSVDFSESDRKMTAYMTFKDKGTYYIQFNTDEKNMYNISVTMQLVRNSYVAHSKAGTLALMLAMIVFYLLNASWVYEKFSIINDKLADMSED